MTEHFLYCSALKHQTDDEPTEKMRNFLIDFDLNHLIEFLWVLSTFSIAMNHISNQPPNTFNISTNFLFYQNQVLKDLRWKSPWNEMGDHWRMAAQERRWSRWSDGVVLRLALRERVVGEKRGERVVLEKTEARERRQKRGRETHLGEREMT